MRLTFKLEKRVTGLAGIAHTHRTTFIKGDGKHVGGIYGPNRFAHHDGWEIRLMVNTTPTPDRPSVFQWVTLKAHFSTSDEAREFVTQKWDALQKKFDLYQSDMEDY